MPIFSGIGGNFSSEISMTSTTVTVDVLRTCVAVIFPEFFSCSGGDLFIIIQFLNITYGHV